MRIKLEKSVPNDRAADGRIKFGNRAVLLELNVSSLKSRKAILQRLKLKHSPLENNCWCLVFLEVYRTKVRWLQTAWNGRKKPQEERWVSSTPLWVQMKRCVTPTLQVLLDNLSTFRLSKDQWEIFHLSCEMLHNTPKRYPYFKENQSPGQIVHQCKGKLSQINYIVMLPLRQKTASKWCHMLWQWTPRYDNNKKLCDFKT